MTEMTPDIEQGNTVIVASWIDHFTGPRWTRRTWRASLAFRDDPERKPLVWCDHRHGHRTISAAKACGLKLWRKLPRADAASGG